MKNSLLKTEELETQQTNTMAKYTRLPTEDFNRDVTAVAMDERFVLVIDVTNCQVWVRELREFAVLKLLLRLKTQKLAEITFFGTPSSPFSTS